MRYALIWRKNQPTVVSYLAGHELDSETFEHFHQALTRLCILKGW